jgi:hypothetical protein
MTIWKVGEGVPRKIQSTNLQQQQLLERHLEDWVAADPSLLGEPLMIIGRQVLIQDVRDKLDLLALDPQGNAVVIELKRGQLKDPVDMQALRYASYISKWSFDDFENQARSFVPKGDPDFDLNEAFRDFCDEAGTEAPQELNQDQRLMIAGTTVRDKLGSVALWLRDHSIDVTIVEMQNSMTGI